MTIGVAGLALATALGLAAEFDDLFLAVGVLLVLHVLAALHAAVVLTPVDRSRISRSP